MVGSVLVLNSLFRGAGVVGCLLMCCPCELRPVSIVWPSLSTFGCWCYVTSCVCVLCVVRLRLIMGDGQLRLTIYLVLCRMVGGTSYGARTYVLGMWVSLGS